MNNLHNTATIQRNGQMLRPNRQYINGLLHYLQHTEHRDVVQVETEAVELVPVD